MTIEIDDSSAEAAVKGMRPPSHYSFDVTSVEREEGFLDLGIAGRRGERPAHVRVALPSSGRDQFWIYVLPVDAADWADQLFTWIEEEVATAGLGSTRERVDEGGRSYVLVCPYGWRLSDPAEHERLLAAAGEAGWYGGGIRGA